MQLYIAKDDGVDKDENTLRTDRHLQRAAALSLRMWFHCKSKTLRVVFSSLKKEEEKTNILDLSKTNRVISWQITHLRRISLTT